jgi:hypothetical protein
MSDLGLIKNLDCFPAAFQRFEGAEKIVVCVNDQLRTFTRDHWLWLFVYRGKQASERSNLDRLG